MKGGYLYITVEIQPADRSPEYIATIKKISKCNEILGIYPPVPKKCVFVSKGISDTKGSKSNFQTALQKEQIGKVGQLGEIYLD